MSALRSILSALAVSAALGAPAQGLTPSASFQKFRQEVMDSYNDFRNEMLNNYSQFLQGVWDDYNGFKGLERDSVPKPEEPPVAEEPKPMEKPTVNVAPTPEITPIPVTIPDPEPKTLPVPVPKPTVRTEPPSIASSTINYYGMPIEMELTKFRIADNIASESEFATQWDRLHSDGLAIKQANTIASKAKEMGLNGYLTFQFVRDWVNATYPNASASSRLSLQHYLMNVIGYEVRIALTGTGDPVLLIPFQQLVYGRPGVMINDQRYYVFPDNDDMLAGIDYRFSTCRLPSNADLGVTSSLIPHKMNLPWSPKKYDISHGGLHIEGEINANYGSVFKNYPLIDIGLYPTANIDPDLRRSVVEQLKPSLEGLPKLKAVNKLLSFVQKGFEYATDHSFHGFEKPYFFEEMLIWDKCDCEDRAIFYTYLLWEILGVENQMIRYPGHESVSVCVPDEISGTKYTANGKDYYISDPTYIGSVTGQCMPKYVSAKPTLDHEYK